MLTSNQGFERWGEILHDEVIAAALLDRLLHRCHIVNNPQQQLPGATPHRTRRDSSPAPLRSLRSLRSAGLKVSVLRWPQVSDFPRPLTD